MLKVPNKTSISDSTINTMMLNSTKYQYSIRLALPLNTAYFLSTSRYQLTRHPPFLANPSPSNHDSMYLQTTCAKEDTVTGRCQRYRGLLSWARSRWALGRRHAEALTGSWPAGGTPPCKPGQKVRGLTGTVILLVGGTRDRKSDAEVGYCTDRRG